MTLPSILLNIGSGKTIPIAITNGRVSDPYFLVNLDKNYFSEAKPKEVEVDIAKWSRLGGDADTQTRLLNCDVFEFLERVFMKFDHISIYRFLEHVPFTKVPYFIYLLSQITWPQAIVDIIVPDFKRLAEIILAETSPGEMAEFFEAHNIMITTELLNEPYDPHASIWTLERLVYFFELENYFEFLTDSVEENYIIDGRETYIRCKVMRRG